MRAHLIAAVCGLFAVLLFLGVSGVFIKWSQAIWEATEQITADQCDQHGQTTLYGKPYLCTAKPTGEAHALD